MDNNKYVGISGHHIIISSFIAQKTFLQDGKLCNVQTNIKSGIMVACSYIMFIGSAQEYNQLQWLNYTNTIGLIIMKLS